MMLTKFAEIFSSHNFFIFTVWEDEMFLKNAKVQEQNQIKISSVILSKIHSQS